jgi:hypothetical protein
MAILQSRARYGLSAFSFIEPELPGSVNNEPGPQLDCAAAKFLPGHCGSPARGACAVRASYQGQCRPSAEQLPVGYALATWLTRRLRPGNGGPDRPGKERPQCQAGGDRRQQTNPEAESIRTT